MADKAYDFAMSFIAASDRYKAQYVDRWREVLANFIVTPNWDQAAKVNSPYRSGSIYRSPRKQIILKDPETHKLVMTYVSKLMRALFGDDRREFIQANPVGWEDVQKSQTVSRLMRYAMGLPHHYRVIQQWLTDMLIYGTGVIESPWLHKEGEIVARSVSEFMGTVESTYSRMRLPIYEDVAIRNVDIEDAFPDPSRALIAEMCGFGKRFRMNKFEAKGFVRGGVYDGASVERAFAGNVARSGNTPNLTSFREGMDKPTDTEGASELHEMIGYEYWGYTNIDEDGYSRRVITIINEEVVRDEKWPLGDPHLPFHSATINPVCGRFYGVAPAEVVRWDQSFADAMKILLAEAMVRRVHPMIAIEQDADPSDIEAIRSWKADAVVTAKGGPNGVGTIRYEADIQGGFGLLNALKNDIQYGSGAPGAIQGEAGPDREAASVGVQRFQAAMDQPELVARLIEEDALPSLGQGILRRYQQFETPEGLKNKIGEQPESAWLGDIMGDFDIQFIGSRQAMSRQAKLQAFDRYVNYTLTVPGAAVLAPNMEMLQWVVGELMTLPEIATQIGNPQTIQMNAIAQQMMGPNKAAGNGNATQPAKEPPGIMPAQAAGGAYE